MASSATPSERDAFSIVNRKRIVIARRTRARYITGARDLRIAILETFPPKRESNLATALVPRESIITRDFKERRIRSSCRISDVLETTDLYRMERKNLTLNFRTRHFDSLSIPVILPSSRPRALARRQSVERNGGARAPAFPVILFPVFLRGSRFRARSLARSPRLDLAKSRRGSARSGLAGWLAGLAAAVRCSPIPEQSESWTCGHGMRTNSFFRPRAGPFSRPARHQFPCMRRRPSLHGRLARYPLARSPARSLAHARALHVAPARAHRTFPSVSLPPPPRARL